MFERLPGFRDFYPEECAMRNHLFRVWRQTAVRYSFSEYDTPLLESLDLFRAKSGEEISSQLFAFQDKGGREVALRPETTPGLARLVGARANSLRRPVKWFSIGEQFRYERQQRGRLRSFYQFNADIIGEEGTGAEVELIALLIDSLTAFGLTDRDIIIRLSDRDLWLHYLYAHGLEETAWGPVLSVIDKIDREPREVSLEKLRPFLGEEAASFWERIEALRAIRDLESLRDLLAEAFGHTGTWEGVEKRLADWRDLLGGIRAMGLGSFVQMDLGIVRGLAYYTGFVFEAFDRSGEFRALAGGGRYNNLLGKLTKSDLPAAGFAVGDVVLRELLSAKGLLPQTISAPDLQMVIGGDPERRAALEDARRLREAGYRVDYPLRLHSFGKQFKAAGQSGARFVLIYGEDELREGSIKLRDLTDGREMLIPRSRLLAALAEYLSP